MVSNVKRISYTFITFILVFCIYKISLLFLKVGMDGASRDIFFIPISLYFCISLIKYMSYRGKVQVDIIKMEEKLNTLFKGFNDKVTPLQGVTLEKDDNEGVIDALVITNKGVFNIVPCSYTGDISIKEDGNWYKVGKREDTMISYPVTKVRKNRELLAKIYDEEEILDIIIMLEDKVDIEGEENSSVTILRNDELKSYIEDYDGVENYDEEELYQEMYSYIKEEWDLVKMKKLYNEYLDSKWQFRSRLAFSSFFFIFYILNLIYMS